MISFENMIIEDGTPIYQQILRHIKRGIVSGSITNNDELPSRRVLSALLGINPNTIQKAYKLLEDENLIESHSGAKSYMKLDENKIKMVKGELIANDITNTVTALKQMGLSKEEAIDLLEKYWNEV
ncbi:MAG: GntR family transcriptional regulator [Ruminococcaceae bacterium]|nr:GntR family transcriptional regulator [Oscillospiraceae bacterium]